ncbi:MAG: GNAT family N-acetyltransferase [Dysgonomonas sp.]
MNLRYQENWENVVWEDVPFLLEEVGMSFSEPDVHKISFQSSHSAIFVFDTNKLVGFGRMLSDGVRQSALYDIAVDPAYQGQGI